MESVVVTWRELLIVVAAVVVIYAAELILLIRWMGAPGHKAWKRASHTGTDAHRVNRLNADVVELREQIARLENEVERLRTVAISNVSPYNQAIHMARQGLSASEVAAGCGISRGEAELIVALYRKLRI